MLFPCGTRTQLQPELVWWRSLDVWSKKQMTAQQHRMELGHPEGLLVEVVVTSFNYHEPISLPHPHDLCWIMIYILRS